MLNPTDFFSEIIQNEFIFKLLSNYDSSLNVIFWYIMRYHVRSGRVHRTSWPSADPNRHRWWMTLQTICCCCQLLRLPVVPSCFMLLLPLMRNCAAYSLYQATPPFFLINIPTMTTSGSFAPTVVGEGRTCCTVCKSFQQQCLVSMTKAGWV